MRPRRVTCEMQAVVDIDHDAEARCSSVAIDGVVLIHTANDQVEMRVDGQTIRVTLAQAWAIAVAVLELGRAAR